MQSTPHAPASVDPATARGLRTVSALYFCFFAGNGVFLVFINVYYRSLGLSGTQIGLINTLAPLAGMVGATLWGMLNDRWGKPRRLFLIVVPGAILASLGLALGQSFGWLALCAAVHQFFGSPLIPLTDSTTLSLLGEQRGSYGKYRVWGTFGFSLTSAMIGFILARTGLRSMFIFYACIYLGLLVASRRLPDVSFSMGRAPSRGVGPMLRQRRWVIFAISVFLMWMALNSAIAFLNITLKAMGASEGLIGLSWTMAAAAETPVMLASAYLLRSVGPARLVLIGYLGYVVRMLLYSVMPSPGWAPAINALNAVSYAPFWLGMVAYVAELAPENLKTTAQGLMGSVMALASMVGALVGGWLFDSVGSGGLFRVMSGFCLLALVLFAAEQRLPAKPRRFVQRA